MHGYYRTNAMSLMLWNRLPPGFLKKRFKGWNRLGRDVQSLIVTLAEKQNFKCVHCPEGRDLIIEHDHDPEIGSGDKLTVFNIRGLVCQGCNWHLMVYEKDRSGEYRGFDDVYSRISDSDWETYIYTYDCRVVRLHESGLERRMGTLKYLKRRNFLDKFDDWKEWGSRKRSYPWRWSFDEMKERKRNIIRTPEQLFKVLSAIFEYVKGEREKNSDWQPPDEIMPNLIRVKAFLDELYPLIESHYIDIKREREAAVIAAQAVT